MGSSPERAQVLELQLGTEEEKKRSVLYQCLSQAAIGQQDFFGIGIASRRVFECRYPIAGKFSPK
jgi:hypothetical protein